MMRILLLSPSLPYPAIWGFNIRVFNLVRHLSVRNQVSLLCFEGREDDEGRRALSEICESITVVPAPVRSGSRRRIEQVGATLGPRSFHLRRYASDEMQSALSRLLHGGRFDLVQVESSAMATFDFGETPVLLDEHNLEYELLRRTSEVEVSPLRRVFGAIESRKVEREEAALWQQVDACVVTSRREQAIVSGRAPSLPIAVVPNGVDLESFRPVEMKVSPASLVFTGLMTYRPNEDAVCHFVRDIFPAIRRARPDTTFTAVGWGLPRTIRPLLGNGFAHTGRVGDIRPYVAGAAVVVVPIRIGSGTRLKVLEALAMGKAVVSTSVGCEGIDAVHGEHLLIADGPAEFAASVLQLLRDPGFAAELGRRGRALVEKGYGWERCATTLERLQETISSREAALSAAGGAGR